MKKSFFLAVAAVAMTACSNDVDLGMKDANKQTADNAIGFEVRNSNMSRAQNLQDTKHYNFGVFAYKQVDASNYQQIMDGYLVGYLGTNVGYKQLLKTTDDGLKYDDPTGSQSKWAYEGLGTKQYDHTANTGDEHYYTTTNTEYMSNFEYQYLRYWDLSANHVNFFAYAPYVNGAKKVTYDNSTHTMTFPMGSIKDGVDDPSLFEYMYASKQVATTDYKKAVSLSFKRMNAKVNIAFYEVIDGYTVTINNLKDGTYDFISAAPATEGSPNTYSNGLYKENGATIIFSGTNFETGDVTLNTAGAKVYGNTEYLKFALPQTPGEIATNSTDALGSKKGTSYSTTTYYAIPKDNDCGLTFHVTFTLTSETGETIQVKDARVFVPKNYTDWKANNAYTYIFKITKNTSGTTVSDPVIKPYDPTVPGNALFPIVFDNCVVEDWTTAGNDTEHDIN